METPKHPALDAKECERRRLFTQTLNDILRTSFVGGSVMVTSGFASLSPELSKRGIQAIQSFNDFTPENDPYGEHDFGAVDLDGQKVFWKIDYYDESLKYASEDPSDAKKTKRVLTIMLAEEY